MSRLDVAALRSYRFPERRHAYAARDAILYALGVGLGADPLDPWDLDHLLETRLAVLPTFAVTLASPGLWVRDAALGIDWVRLVHSAQEAHFHAPLPPAAEVVGSASIAGIWDRGAGKGTMVLVEREIADAASGTLYCTVRQTLLLRGDGGWGGDPPPRDAAPAAPDRAPDAQLTIDVSPRAALIYRLSGDLNPIHADPAVAREAGFERPILHGLATYGYCGAALLRLERRRLASLAGRFTGLVFPGDRLDLALWRQDGSVLFQARVGDRIVLDRGLARFTDAPS